MILLLIVRYIQVIYKTSTKIFIIFLHNRIINVIFCLSLQQTLNFF